MSELDTSSNLGMSLEKWFYVVLWYTELKYFPIAKIYQYNSYKVTEKYRHYIPRSSKKSI